MSWVLIVLLVWLMPVVFVGACMLWSFALLPRQPRSEVADAPRLPVQPEPTVLRDSVDATECSDAKPALSGLSQLHASRVTGNVLSDEEEGRG